MKKYILLIVLALTCSVLSTHALSLKEAYGALSNLPKISKEFNDTVSVKVNGVDITTDMQVSGARNLNSEDIKAVGNATYVILNQIPLSYMINGGNNGYVAAFVYCTPNETGSNDMLIVTMSGQQGDLTYLFVTNVDENSKLYLQEGKLTLQGSSLSIIPGNTNGLIGAIKVN
ncbi:MAG: hypothetical protein J6C91_03430 [Muribaculaceae bacterium]|nr:hypothetical protein [Muribaculaceae bacterium]